MTLLDNLKKYINTGNAGNCPMCGGKIEVTIDKTPARDNTLIKCKKCKKQHYILGIYHEPQSKERP